MADDLPLTVSWSSMSEFFNCPVCLCQLTSTHITPCGHRYCEKCIKEWIDRNHKCPCCNAITRQTNLIKDPVFDELVETAVKEKEASEHNYFDKLINTATDTCSPDSASSEYTHHLSPVEAVLKKHLRNSLAAHERYYQEMKTESSRQKEILLSSHKTKIEDLYAQGVSDVQERIDGLKIQLDVQKSKLQDDIDRCGQLIAEAYNKYLSQHIPTLAILPVAVSLCVLNKNLEITNVELKPQHGIDDIKRLLQQLMEERGDPIVEFDPQVKFLSFGPFARRSVYEMQQMALNVVEHGATHTDIMILPERSQPVLQFSLKPGSVIALYGIVKCKSDAPKHCFAREFQPNRGLTVDYFSCAECRINWVCRACMENCHKEHTISPYIMQHKPTWACCYCPRKKLCTLPAQS